MSAHNSIAEFMTKLPIPSTAHSWLKSVSVKMHSVDATTKITVCHLFNTVGTIQLMSNYIENISGEKNKH